MTEHEGHAMSGPDDPAATGAFGAHYWEDRYRGGQGASRHDPSPSLVAEAGGLPPGRALDAGCGRGADAVWLASRGWRVTAVDVSATVLDQARRDALAAGPDLDGRIEWVHADLTAWEPDGSVFDLVSSHYVHVPGPAADLFARLASFVAPDGTLLVVGHDASHGHGQTGHAHPPGAQVRVEQVTAQLPPDRWDVVVAERRVHTVRSPGRPDPVALHDVVVRATRTGPA